MAALSLTCKFTSFTVRQSPKLKKLPKEEKRRGEKTRRRRRRRRMRTGMGRLLREMLGLAAVARL